MLIVCCLVPSALIVELFGFDLCLDDICCLLFVVLIQMLVLSFVVL